MAKSKRGKRGNLRLIKCMNSFPSHSKWGRWAPEGGCDEKIEVDDNCRHALCWKCTHRVMGGQHV